MKAFFQQASQSVHRFHFRTVILVLIAIISGSLLLGFFYNFSQRSEATNPPITLTFQTGSMEVAPGGVVDALVWMQSGTNAVSIGTIGLTYDTAKLSFVQDSLTSCGDGTSNPNLNSIRSVADTGLLEITRSKTGRDEELPSGLFCFGKVQFAIAENATGTSEINFLDINDSIYDIVGPGPTSFAPNLGTPSAIQINISSDTNLTPTPTTALTPTATLTPSPTPTIDPNVPTATPTATLIPTRTPTPTVRAATNTPTPVDTSLLSTTIKARFQGVTGTPRNTENLPVKVSLLFDDTEISEKTVTFSHLGDGIYQGVYSLSAPITPRTTSYRLLIKGPKHIQKLICDETPTETLGGNYVCKTGRFISFKNQGTIDLTGIILLAGDLPVQNQIVDSLDLAFIRNNLGSTNSEALKRGDLNYDNIIDTQDYTLIINALAFKYDEGVIN